VFLAPTERLAKLDPEPVQVHACGAEDPARNRIGVELDERDHQVNGFDRPRADP
jgi:hypothetical protein